MSESILGTTGEPTKVALAELQAATRTDWRAAAWLLQHSPATRAEWGDMARQREIEVQLIGRMLKALDAAALPPDWHHRVLLAMQAHGVGLTAETEEAEDVK